MKVKHCHLVDMTKVPYTFQDVNLSHGETDP